MDPKKILHHASDYSRFSAENLSTIVKIPSFSGGERDVILKLEELCRNIGLDDIRIDGLGSLIARVGTGPKKLVIDAHVDTVGVGDPSQWKHEPFSGLIRDGLVHGRGASDQKGGAASMLTAARILKDLNYAGDYSVYFTFTVIEEDCDGMCWKYLIEEEKFVPDLFVSTEPTTCRLYRGHRGRMEMEVFFKGVSCHGSAPERGVNAGYKAARGALALEKLNEALEPDDDRFLGKGKPFYLPKECLPFSRALRLIKEAGGIAVVAHPYSLFVSKTKLAGLMDEWKAAGVEGVEAFHPTAKLGQCRILEYMARERGFLVTAGSDFHNLQKPDCGIGRTAGGIPVTDSFYEELSLSLPGLPALT